MYYDILFLNKSWWLLTYIPLSLQFLSYDEYTRLSHSCPVSCPDDSNTTLSRKSTKNLTDHRSTLKFKTLIAPLAETSSDVIQESDVIGFFIFCFFAIYIPRDLYIRPSHSYPSSSDVFREIDCSVWIETVCSLNEEI